MHDAGQAGGTTSPVRIDGWKAIGAHFRRDRTTVFRWARDDGLPVRRVPIAGKGSVFAYVHELDAWLATQREGPAESAPPARAKPLPPRPSPRLSPRLGRWLRSLSQAVAARRSTASR